ncbi:helix-turn-helix transcriptional regulator [Streptomyces profundus]|uniref:helix-turn-helix transcriptional regulator n=1 Tax=Streptomyces profundus TaxID=2867410 RepID=UPI001D16F98B|nr:WYL domain-containing protein [Streptomyces sp. MA3_2.13]UED85805.1 WYL domain-containing protein [Streptomyces sp. MA3_2.13]
MVGMPSRMLKLLSLLQTRRDWPGQVLSERLEISDRTLRRDIDRLRELGYRITAVKGPDGGYRLDAGSELPPLLFDDDQAVTLAIALRAAAASGAADGEAALWALTTIRQVLPSRLRHRMDAMTFTTLPAGTGAVADPAVLLAVSAAVRASEVVRFDYVPVGRAPDSGPSPRRVEPHHVVFGNGSWYLVGWDLDVDDWRVYRLDRLTPRIPTGPRFRPRTVPGGEVRDFLSGRFRGSAGGSEWPCTGSVVLRLPAREVIPFVPDGMVEELGPDRCRLTAGSWSWVALAASFGRFDAPVSEVAPRELADAFDLLSRRFADLAPRPPDSPGGGLDEEVSGG